MKSVLLIPSEQDRRLLLSSGVCGNAVPGAIRHYAKAEKHGPCMDCDFRIYDHSSDDAILHCSECHEDWPCGRPNKALEPEHWTLNGSGTWWNKPDALVLVWKGQVVAEGCDRARRVLGKLLFASYSIEEAESTAERYVLTRGGEVLKVLS